MPQARISPSAIQKAKESGSEGVARFIVHLNDALLSPEEVAALHSMGMVEFMPLFRQAMVVLPGRHLLEVAELSSVVRVM